MATATATCTAATAYTTVDHRSYPYYPHPAIHGFNVPPGVYISSPPDQHEALLGRKLSPTPRRLAGRTLYLPSHSDEATHLPIYDFTREYREAVRDEPIGSSRFRTILGLMEKPVGDGRGASEVSYLVDFEPLEARRSPSPPGAGRTSARGGGGGSRRRRKSSASSLGGHATRHATVRRRMLYGGAEVGLTIPPRGMAMDNDGDGDGDVACTITPASTEAGIDLVTSYPLRPTVSKFGTSRNPWFTFTVPPSLLGGGGGGERTLQWQVHPAEHGLLRYTLVELPRHAAAAEEDDDEDDDRWWEKKEKEKRSRKASRGRERSSSGAPFSASERKNEHLIRAIYTNVGLGFCLSQPFSEGALLLQNDLDPELEAVVVASLLGLLWRARGEESKPRRKNSKSEGSALARKKSVSVPSVDEKEWASRHSSPERKGLLGKILRRMS